MEKHSDCSLNEHIEDKITALLNWVGEIHDKHADGCKGTCTEREIGFHYSKYYESHWFCNFGGYCIGYLHRQEEVKADSFEALERKVKAIILDSIEKLEKDEKEDEKKEEASHTTTG